jgi:hypothetical protein
MLPQRPYLLQLLRGDAELIELHLSALVRIPTENASCTCHRAFFTALELGRKRAAVSHQETSGLIIEFNYGDGIARWKSKCR